MTPFVLFAIWGGLALAAIAVCLLLSAIVAWLWRRFTEHRWREFTAQLHVSDRWKPKDRGGPRAA